VSTLTDARSEPTGADDAADAWAETFLLDSDVAIEHLRGRSWTRDLFTAIARVGGSVCYSPVTQAEIYHGLRPNEEEPTARLFANLECMLIDDAIGRRAGDYLRHYRPSHDLALGDALIAATARERDLVLLTLNRRHYPMPDLRLAVLPLA
jgi:predicted nucleic acid-binding protein